MVLQKKNILDNVSKNDVATIVAEGTRVTGDFVCSNHLRIDGHISGNIYCDSKVIIGSAGMVKGNIQCANAEIAGNLEGDINASESLILRKNAVLRGNINTNMLQMDSGVEFNGKCSMGYTAEGKDRARLQKQEEATAV